MTTLAEIEASYYKAIQAAKLSEADEVLKHVHPYSKEKFEHWVRKVNIYDLGKHKADFYLDETIVTNFEDYRSKVTAKLAKCVEYDRIKLKGQTKNIGSCHDGSKIGKMNEVDNLYVLNEDNIIVEDTDGIFRIIWKEDSANCEILPEHIRDQFTITYADIISKLPLPDCLKHAGYRSPGYSGMRYNGPAVTSQFLAKVEDKDQRLLTWDMTPAVCLGKEHGKYVKIREIMKPILKVNPDKMFGAFSIHLIPDPNENLWRMSTAQLEADLLRELIPSVAPMKTAISYSKALASQLKQWNFRNLSYTSLDCIDCDVDIVKELDSYLESPEKDFGERLNQVLRYAHIWIPPEKRKLYHEDEKAYVSINTAAIKHIILAAALEQPEAFSAKGNADLVFQLVKVVFDTIGNPSEFSVPHAFLKGVRIPHLSILSSQATDKVALAFTIKEQCRMLASGAMTKVRDICFVPR